MIKTITTLLLFSTFLFVKCSKETVIEKKIYIDTDSLSGTLVADTITYDVIIKNIDPGDVWAEECLRYLDRKMLIDSIFSSVYTGRLKAYDLFSNNELSIKEIRTLEQADWYSREAIGKIQFSEIWYFDASNTVFKKKPLSLVLGLEQFSESGEFKGYKPVFKVFLN